MTRLPAIAFLLIVSMSTSPVEAKGSKSLYLLASQYRSAVSAFEETVLEVRGIDRADERLVDRLDDGSAKMRLAAKNPRHLNRLFHEWQDVQKLHFQVESRIFGKYTPNYDLTQAWNLVTYNYILFAQEYFYQVENPNHDGAVRRIPLNSARRSRYLPEGAKTPPGITGLPFGTILLPPTQ